MAVSLPKVQKKNLTALAMRGKAREELNYALKL